MRTPTRAWPTDEPSRTPTDITPTATAPAGGWVEWQNPPAELVNTLALDVEWWLSQFGSDDPLQKAVNAKFGAAWPLGAPMVTHYVMGGTALRWQVFVTPQGIVFAFATPAEPYRVAIIEW
jgi:hypothetical protein